MDFLSNPKIDGDNNTYWYYNNSKTIYNLAFCTHVGLLIIKTWIN